MACQALDRKERVTMVVTMQDVAGLGHHQIVFVPRMESDRAELVGAYVRIESAYRRLAERHAIPPVVMPCRSVSDGRKAAVELATAAPDATAVVVGDEAAAAGLVAGLHSRGIMIPDDVSVLSVLTSVEFVSACNPPLIVVSTPGSELGRLGVQALLRQLEGEPPTDRCSGPAC
jgi:DNA-binding LacI/PurR family transcriptional regulator